MGGVVKNLLITTVIVIAGTIASVTIASLSALFLTTPAAAAPADAMSLTFALLIAVGAALIAGAFFCLVTLFMATLTMPPVLWLTRMFLLPRPAVDMIGGAAAAYLCVEIALEEADSLAAYGLFTGRTPEIFTVVGIAAGAGIGLLRYILLKPERREAPMLQAGGL